MAFPNEALAELESSLIANPSPKLEIVNADRNIIEFGVALRT